MSFRKGGLNDFFIFSKLQSFVDEFVSSMAYERYVKQEYDHVKLHATVINSIFRQRKQDTDKSNPNYYAKKVPFDAREILQVRSNINWMKLPILHKNHWTFYSEFWKLCKVPPKKHTRTIPQKGWNYIIIIVFDPTTAFLMFARNVVEMYILSNKFMPP